MGVFRKKSKDDARGLGNADVIGDLVKANLATGSAESMHQLWDTVMRLDEWHFMSTPVAPDMPASGPGSPMPIIGSIGEMPDKRLLFAFTDDKRAHRAMVDNGIKTIDGMFTTITMQRDGAAHYAHKLQQDGVWGILFNHCKGEQGFFAPLANIAPMYECAHGVVLPGLKDSRPTPDFDSLAKAFKSTEYESPQYQYTLTAYLRCLLNLDKWCFLSDKERPGSPMMWAVSEEIVLLGFTDPHRAAHAAKKMKLLDEDGAADVIEMKPSDTQRILDEYRKHGVQRIVFNLSTEPLPLHTEGLLSAMEGK